MNHQDIENLFTSKKKDFFKVARENKVSILFLKRFIFNTCLNSYKGSQELFLLEIHDLGITKYISKKRLKDFTTVECTNSDLFNTLDKIYKLTQPENIKQLIFSLKSEGYTMRRISAHLCINNRQLYNILNDTLTKHKKKKTQKEIVTSKRERDLLAIKKFEETHFTGRIITRKNQELLAKYGKLEKYQQNNI